MVSPSLEKRTDTPRSPNALCGDRAAWSCGGGGERVERGLARTLYTCLIGSLRLSRKCSSSSGVLAIAGATCRVFEKRASDRVEEENVEHDKVIICREMGDEVQERWCGCTEWRVALRKDATLC